VKVLENKEKTPDKSVFLISGRAICAIHELIFCMNFCSLGEILKHFWKKLKNLDFTNIYNTI